MNATLVRAVIAAGVIWYALNSGGSPLPGPVAPYSGSLTNVHSSSRSMAAKDREVMSEAFRTASDMLEADKRDLVSDTQKAQDYVIGVLSFSYVGVGKPAAKYPAVAEAIEAELQKVYGSEVKKLSPSEKQQIVDVLDEIGKAVK